MDAAKIIKQFDDDGLVVLALERLRPITMQ